MSVLFRLVCATACPSTHHKLAMDSLQQLRCAEADEWQRLFLNYYEAYLRGAKAPDAEFKDFKNHVLHVNEGNWGGAISAAQLWYDRTVLALRRQYWVDAVYSAGVLSHYVTDPFMPLHTGQTEEEGKVHRALEWSVTRAYESLRRQLLERGGFPPVAVSNGPGWLGELIKFGAQAANEHYFPSLDHYNLAKGVQDPPSGLDDDLRSRMARQLGLAVSAFARVLDRAIQEARVRPPMVELLVETVMATVKMPLRAILNRLEDAEAREEVEEIYEEVRRRGKAIESLPEDDALVRKLHCEQVLRIPLAQLDAQPARATGTRHERGASGSLASSATGRFGAFSPTPADPSPLGAYASSERPRSATSEAARRVPVPASRGASSGETGRGGASSRGAARGAGGASGYGRRPSRRFRRHGLRPSSVERPVDGPRPVDDRTDAAPSPLQSTPPRRDDVDRIDRIDSSIAARARDDSGRYDERTDERRASAERSNLRRNPRERLDDDSHDDVDERRTTRQDEAHDEQSHETHEAAAESPRRTARPGRFRRRLRLQATRAARAVKRGVRTGVVAPAAAVGRAVKNIAGRMRPKRRTEEAAPTDGAQREDGKPESRDAASSTPRDAARSKESRSNDRADSGSNSGSNGRRGLKFYLEESSPVVDAPSIGSKTARRLESAGVHSVADLLDADPESLAAQLDVSWADADRIVQWQQQAELASRVPRLRGHDAQLLSGVGVTSVDELASLDAASLWELVEPFLDTQEAESILRGGRRPDLAEVRDWIEAARDARPRSTS